MENRLAYQILETVRDKNGEYIPCIAEEGVSGYTKTDWHWGTDKELAQSCIDDKNERLGLDKKEAMKIIFSSMKTM